MKKILLLGLSLFLVSAVAFAQGRKVTGIVSSGEDGGPIPGATVLVKGTSVGAATDIDGKYTLDIPTDGKVLVFSFIGTTTQEINIGQQSVIDVVLQPDVQSLSEVVITGAAGIESRRVEMGYNATSIETRDVAQGRAANVAAGLTGKVAGLQINTTGSGVNPNVRVILRGSRSLTGDNEALIVVDNVIVPNTILGNLNPQDIQEITVLNGANAAALYGSAASNGALIIVTKKGKSGAPKVTVGHTVNLEQVSFYPKIQDEFGSGYAGGYPHEYVSYENQQYGPRFDGSMVQIGKPLEDGSIQTVPYSNTNSKNDFWETGVTNQTDVSISGGDDKSTNFFSAQYLTNDGTTPGDKYTRASVRFNSTRKFSDKLSLNLSTNYVQNKYDITRATSSMYDQILQTPAHVPLTSYKDWRNDPFANPNGYYNEYYDNPYFQADNSRQDSGNNYLVGNVELKYKPLTWLDFTYRVGMSNRTNYNKSTTGKFTFTDYTKGISSAKTDMAGYTSDGAGYSNQLISDFLINLKKPVGDDLFFNLLLGNQLRKNQSKNVDATANGLVIPDLYNVSNRVGEAGASESNFESSQVGVFAQFKTAYKDYLFLELTGRNDWVSTLSKENRSFFYPAANVSFVASDAFPTMKGKVISQFKVRGGISQVGQVNLDPYELNPTFSPSSGFPFGSLSGYSLDNRLVAADLEPEITTSYEFGTDFILFDGKVNGSFTYYQSETENQTIPTGVANSTGFSSYLQNTGIVINQGYETMLNVTAFSRNNFQINIGANYTFNDNYVKEIADDLDRLALSTGGNAQVYAIEGESYPMLIGSVYKRDDQGRIIVDANSGYPSVAEGQVQLGNTQPRHRLGLNTELLYKGFRLYALAEYRGGYSIYYSGGGSFDFSGSGITTTYFNRERFVIPNSSYENPESPGTYIENTNVTVTDGGAGFWTDGSFRRNVAENYLIDGAYWKLREVALSYDFPATMMSKIGFIQGATITAQGRNLLIFTPNSNIYTDPDFNFNDGNAVGIVTLSASPPTRFYGGSITLTF
ncbi:TonB-linked SusC/RagA family outer membrane protein [Algoriphagus ratkowskyi]|uniref:SusC/RagA family TonB-linked outer membrane protein n=1 Tax=Algoriphagus ratkowskyi TaxID=57028 RepID=A0A2W7R560_9BACT|nr:SusC/RagA family TonB-linked outer membrane protein [Algoriphagus ratkowskyi]PZX55958.1 TonB-linked SusC/RagA family outer membrane protein [Algoriphagus ratkowskyi]TXD77229.1 SusC/RagA family TonB-linked outer membrane protein [Algoriphagus ratkowskyi]